MRISDIVDTVRGDTPRVIGPVVWNLFPNAIGALKQEVDARQYYLDPEVKFHVQYGMKEALPEAILLPGFFYDFGCVTEASAFGGRIRWFKDNAPFIYEVMDSLTGVDRLTIPEPGTTGFTAVALVHRERMRRLLKEKGEDMETFILSMGPSELAGLLAGHDSLFTGFYNDQKRLKQLLEICTDFIIKWIKLQVKSFGGGDLIFLADHTLSQISPKFLEEFVVPCFKAITSEFPASVKVYHNEGPHQDKHIQIVPELGCDIWHYGTQEYNLPDLLAKLPPEIVLFGGIGPNGAMRTKGPGEVRAEVREALSHIKGHRFLFGHGTGTTPETSYENQRAMVEETVKCLKES